MTICRAFVLFVLVCVTGCIGYTPAKMPIQYISSMEVSQMHDGDVAYAESNAINVGTDGTIYLIGKCGVHNEPPIKDHFLKIMKSEGKFYVVGYGEVRYSMTRDVPSSFYYVAGYTRRTVEHAVNDDLLVMFKSPTKQTN